MRPVCARRALFVAALLACPAVARADAIDAIGVVAMPLVLLWGLVALFVLAAACFAQPPSAGARVALTALLGVIWGPAVLFALSAGSLFLTLIFIACVVGGLVRVWRELPPDHGP